MERTRLNFGGFYFQKFQIVLIVVILCKLSEGKSYIEDLTLKAKEKEVLDQFKDRVASKLPHDYMKKDQYLIRWLRSRYFDIAEAEKMLMENLKWRDDNGMDAIHEEDWSDYQRDYKYSLKPRTKDGKVTLYGHMGRWDIRRAAISGKTEKFHRYIDKLIDEANNLVRNEAERLQNVSQGILILNLQGFNLVQQGCLQCIPVILRIISSYETHYPGLADKMILLNTPSMAEPIIRMARFALHPLTNRDFYVYGTNRREFLKALDEDYTLDQLPIEVGGTLILDDSLDYEY